MLPMSEIVTEQEAKVIGKLVPNGNRYLISIPKDYTSTLQQIKSKRVIVTVKPLV